MFPTIVLTNGYLGYLATLKTANNQDSRVVGTRLKPSEFRRKPLLVTPSKVSVKLHAITNPDYPEFMVTPAGINSKEVMTSSSFKDATECSAWNTPI